MANMILRINRALGLKAFAASLVLVVIFANEASGAEVSGVYIASTPGLVEMVQIVKTPDGRIAGRFEATTLNKKGELETSAFTIEGAASGAQITLSTKSILFNGDLSLTGFVDGDLLDLSWSNGHRTYQRGDSYSYQAAVTGLRAQAGQVLATISADKARAAHSELLEILNRLRTNAPDIKRQLDEAAERYNKLYGRAHNRRRAASMYWDLGDMNGLARQANREALQAETDIRRLDDAMRRLFAALRQDTHQAGTLVASLQTFCAENDGTEGSSGICSELTAKVQELTSLSDRLHGAFDTLAARKERASLDTPPGQKLLKKIFD